MDDDGPSEEQIIRMEETIRRLASEGRLPTLERLRQVMDKVSRDVYSGERKPGA